MTRAPRGGAVILDETAKDETPLWADYGTRASRHKENHAKASRYWSRARSAAVRLVWLSCPNLIVLYEAIPFDSSCSAVPLLCWCTVIFENFPAVALRVNSG